MSNVKITNYQRSNIKEYYIPTDGIDSVCPAVLADPNIHQAYIQVQNSITLLNSLLDNITEEN